MSEKVIDGCCHIFGAAPLGTYGGLKVKIEENDTAICADGGYDRALHLGVIPNWIVGDFDSKQSEQLPENVIRVRSEKDETDMQLAVNQGIDLGYRRFIIYGGLGGRFDHSMANLQLLAELYDKGIFATLYDEQNQVLMMKGGSLEFKRDDGDYKYISIFSFSERCEGVTLTGMKYPLTDYTLTNRSGGLGTSNEIVDEMGRIEISNGTLIIIRTKD